MTQVTTDAVLEAIRLHSDSKGALPDIDHPDSGAAVSTVDIALLMGVPEYPVRVAFSWLVRYGLIEPIKGTCCMRRTRVTGERYTATLYRLRAESGPADFDALYKVFFPGHVSKQG